MKTFRTRAQIRALENWLPLAEAIRQRTGWQLSATELEQLILRALPFLRQARTHYEAQATIWRAMWKERGHGEDAR